MRRKAYDEAVSHWSELLPLDQSLVLKAVAFHNLADCCNKLGRLDDARKSIARAQTLYKEAAQEDKKLRLEADLERLKALKDEIK